MVGVAVGQEAGAGLGAEHRFETGHPVVEFHRRAEIADEHIGMTKTTRRKANFGHVLGGYIDGLHAHGVLLADRHIVTPSSAAVNRITESPATRAPA